MNTHTGLNAHHRPDDYRTRTTTLHVGGLHFATEKAIVERALQRQPGVIGAEANPVAQTATVTFDPAATSIADLKRWIEECGYQCAGQSVPGHVCDPMLEPGGAPTEAPTGHEHATPAIEAAAHDHAATQRADQAHGHGHGGHAGMSMDAMVRDMRNRFVVAAAFAVPIAAEGQHPGYCVSVRTSRVCSGGSRFICAVFAAHAKRPRHAGSRVLVGFPVQRGQALRFSTRRRPMPHSRPQSATVRGGS